MKRLENADIKPEENSSKVLAAVAYLPIGTLGVLLGITLYAIARDKYVKFHALQALLLQLTITLVVGAIVLLGFLLYIPIFFVTFGTSNCIVIPLFLIFVILLIIINLYLIYLAYSGKAFLLPFIGKIALDHLS